MIVDTMHHAITLSAYSYISFVDYDVAEFSVLIPSVYSFGVLV
jgi:hypothetical protein